MKKKVLLVSSGGLDKSGAPSVIMAFVRGLHDDFDFDILLHTRDEGFYEKEFLSYGGRILRCAKKKSASPLLNRLRELGRPVALYFSTRRLIRENGPYQILHCHNDFDMAGCLAAGQKEKIPIRIGHTHKTWNPGGGVLTRVYRALCRRVINRSATVRTGCSAIANRRFYGAEAPSVVTFNPYQDDRFFFDPAFSSPPGPPAIVQIGYFCENKNQLFTLGVLHQLQKKLPGATLVFVGAEQGGYGRLVREEVARLGLESSVSFLPPDADLPSVLKKSSLLLLPSKAEGFGIVLIEAQAAGLSCYASDTVPKETDAGGVTFLPLSAGPEAWADTILREHRFDRKTPHDCSRFSLGAFLAAVRRLYSGEKEG